MFTVIYSFEVKPGQEQPFTQAWRDLTTLIYAHEGSLGSRLHKQRDLHYIAYAQWPDRSTWEHMGGHLPETAKAVSRIMQEACVQIETLYELEVVDDLLRTEVQGV